MITFAANTEDLLCVTRKLQEDRHSAGLNIIFNETEYTLILKEDENIYIDDVVKLGQEVLNTYARLYQKIQKI